ncbi:RluA family pseudouridine synthase [Candidatus Hepatincolaceae symbiont of Richtersius coronifer]
MIFNLKDNLITIDLELAENDELGTVGLLFQNLIVTDLDNNLRLDVFLCKYLEKYSRSKIKSLIDTGNVQLKTKVALVSNMIINSASHKVKVGDEFIIKLTPEKQDISIKSTAMDLDLVFEDQYLIVINKPAGLVVHPGAANFDNTLVNGLLHKFSLEGLSQVNGQFRAGIIHRLDKDTSGIMVVAKDDYTHASLAKQFEVHSIVRNYRALAWGLPIKRAGDIETFIRRSDFNRIKMAVSHDKGKSASTHYKILKSHKSLLSLVDLKLKTGRTHQIRVHMCHIGHSLVGDPLYNADVAKLNNQLEPTIQNLIKNLNRQALHAYKLGFVHPHTQEYLCFTKPEPLELLELYQALALVD